MAVVSELVTKFSFVGSLAPQADFNSGLKTSVGLLAGATVGLAAAAGGFFAWTASVLNGIDPLAQLNRETGIGVENMQELGYVASVSGSSADAMTSSLAGLSKATGDAARGLGRGKKAFEDLGISIRDSAGEVKSADVVLDELRGRFAELGTSMGEQQSIMASLGIDASLLQTLNLTNEQMLELRATANGLGVVTKEQADAAADFNDALFTLGFGMDSIKNRVAVGFAPALTDLAESFTGLLKDNKDLIEGGLTKLGDILLSTMGMMKRMIPVVGIATAGFLAWKLAAIGLSGAMGILSKGLKMVFGALFSWVGLIVLAVLVIDDLMVAFQGGESVIADFMQSIFGIDIVPYLKAFVSGFMEMLDGLLNLMQPFVDMVGHIFDAIVSLISGDFAGMFSSLWSAFGSFADGLVGLIMPVIDYIVDAIRGAFKSAVDSVFGFFSEMFNSLKGLALNILPDWAIDLIGGDSTAAAPITANAAMAMGGGSNSTSNSSIEQQVQINVSSNDPRAAGAAVNDALQGQLKAAKTQVNRGGR